jgi:phage shock protein A
MGIFDRLGDILKANVNDLLDHAEDPEKMIKQMVIEMEEALDRSTLALGHAIGNEKTLIHQLDDQKKEIVEYQAMAVEAVNLGRDDLAKQALEKKNMLVRAAQEMEEPIAESQKATASLKQQVDILKGKVEEARMRESTLIARAQAAKARKQAAQSVAGIGDSGTAGFEKFEERIEKAEGEAEAFETMAGEKASNLEKDLGELSDSKSADDELAKLKESLGKQP